jgi:hypothetical protein
MLDHPIPRQQLQRNQSRCIPKELNSSRRACQGPATLHRNLKGHGCSCFAQKQAENLDDLARRQRGSDFIHSETRKMTITHLSSTNCPRNSRRFLAIFVGFYAQNGPNSAQIRPGRPVCVRGSTGHRSPSMTHFPMPVCETVKL